MTCTCDHRPSLKGLAALALGVTATLAPLRSHAQETAPAAPPALGPPLTGPACDAGSAILVDAATGTVLWEKEAHTRRPMASTTKIMTATMLLENSSLEDRVTFSKHAVATPYANLNAKPGEQFRMRDLLYAIMLRSSNDACVAAGEHTAGSAWRFTTRMTQKARELGALNTNFVTTNGLYHPEHYSTAYDLALITRYAMQYPLFNEIIGTRSVKISRSINWKDTFVRNHNKFLSRYSGADGVKTGYVRQSGRCLVTSATRYENGQPWRLIAVVLKSPDTYGESTRLMDWGFKNFEPIFFARKGEQVAVASVRGGALKQVPLRLARDLTAVVRRGRAGRADREVRVGPDIQAPVTQDQVGGTMVALLDGQPVGQADLVAASPVNRVPLAALGLWPFFPMGLAALVLGPRYARKITKGTRRRGHRITARCREVNC